MYKYDEAKIRNAVSNFSEKIFNKKNISKLYEERTFALVEIDDPDILSELSTGRIELGTDEWFLRDVLFSLPRNSLAYSPIFENEKEEGLPLFFIDENI